MAVRKTPVIFVERKEVSSNHDGSDGEVISQIRNLNIPFGCRCHLNAIVKKSAGAAVAPEIAVVINDEIATIFSRISFSSVDADELGDLEVSFMLYPPVINTGLNYAFAYRYDFGGVGSQGGSGGWARDYFNAALVAPIRQIGLAVDTKDPSVYVTSSFLTLTVYGV